MDSQITIIPGKRKSQREKKRSKKISEDDAYEPKKKPKKRTHKSSSSDMKSKKEKQSKIKERHKSTVKKADATGNDAFSDFDDWMPPADLTSNSVICSQESFSKANPSIHEEMNDVSISLSDFNTSLAQGSSQPQSAEISLTSAAVASKLLSNGLKITQDNLSIDLQSLIDQNWQLRLENERLQREVDLGRSNLEKQKEGAKKLKDSLKLELEANEQALASLFQAFHAANNQLQEFKIKRRNFRDKN